MGQAHSVPPPLQNRHTTTKNVSNEPSVAKRSTESELITKLKERSIRRSEVTREQIKKLLNASGGDEIITTHLNVSLTCPLSKVRMSIPCRGSICSHVQCFDAAVYIRMNGAKPTWKCPICSQPASYKDLIIDGYFQEILNSNKLLPGVNDIRLLKNGSWKNMVDETPATKNVDKIESLTKNIETIDLTRSPPPQSRSKKEIVVIDLTSDTNVKLALSLLNPSSRKFYGEILQMRKMKSPELSTDALKKMF